MDKENTKTQENLIDVEDISMVQNLKNLIEKIKAKHFIYGLLVLILFGFLFMSVTMLNNLLNNGFIEIVQAEIEVGKKILALCIIFIFMMLTLAATLLCVFLLAYSYDQLRKYFAKRIVNGYYLVMLLATLQMPGNEFVKAIISSLI